MTTVSPASPVTATLPSVTSTTAPAWIAPGEQGFLVGETLYLRTPEAADAAFSLAWNPSPFPVTRARAEKIISEDQPKASDQRVAHFVACRRDNDEPVGGCEVNFRMRHAAWITLAANPGLTALAAPVAAEIIRIVVPYVSAEMGQVMVWLPLDGPAPELIAAAEAVGMRPAVRLREWVWRDGARHDRWLYELPHPAAIERFGDPGPSIEQEVAPLTLEQVPAVRRYSVPAPVSGPVPPNALIVGPRVALRLADADDAKEHSRLLRHETDTQWDSGRWLDSAPQFERWMKKEGEADPPGGFTFAVVLRESNQLIGLVSLIDVNWFNRTAETGSILYLPEHRSQGYGSEAKNLMIEYAFDHLHLHALESTIFGFNPRSQAAIRKQGYRDAGRYQWVRLAPSGMDHMVVFDLLASEWRERVNAAADR